jgi:hypothetical protein
MVMEVFNLKTLLLHKNRWGIQLHNDLLCLHLTTFSFEINDFFLLPFYVSQPLMHSLALEG